VLVDVLVVLCVEVVVLLEREAAIVEPEGPPLPEAADPHPASTSSASARPARTVGDLDPRTRGGIVKRILCVAKLTLTKASGVGSGCAQARAPRRSVGGSATLSAMSEEATAVGIGPRPGSPAVETRPHVRLLHGMRKPANWLQLVRFGLVGGTGFVVNLAVYALCVHALRIDYQVSAVAAWLVAVTNNFFLNRHWTFDARGGRIRFQAVRFFVVSLVAFGFSFLLLLLFVETGGMAKVPAQALAVAASTPLNFIGNKLWSFRSRG
jgi:putative flippase GtrA